MLKATHTLSRSALMRKAWVVARHGAERFGDTARQHLAAALRQAWAAEEAAVAALVAQEERVRETAAFLVSVERAAAARRGTDRAEFRRSLAEELARPRIRPPVADPDTRAFLRRMAEAQARMAEDLELEGRKMALRLAEAA